MNREQLIERLHLADCTRCKNECAEACPVYRHYGTYHPQQLAQLFLEGRERAGRDHKLVWSCVTCRACNEACPFKVDFDELIREMRKGRTDFEPAFEGLIRSFQRMQAELPSGEDGGARKSELAAGAVDTRSRLDWLDGSLKIDPRGDTVLFIGCLPLFERVFEDTCGVSPLETARAAVRLLNALGIAPRILEDERCCGRDLYDIGERAPFRKLAEHNVAVLRRAGAKRVITICPECTYTFRRTYSGELGGLPFEVKHITETIELRIGELKFFKETDRFAFHDPCYLARYLGVTEPPRKLLQALTTEPLIPLKREGKGCACCGAGSWVNHGQHTRAAARERILGAHRSGAQVLVTACPKCTMLFQEANPGCSWKMAPIKVRDLITLAASRLEKKQRRADRRYDGKSDE